MITVPEHVDLGQWDALLTAATKGIEVYSEKRAAKKASKAARKAVAQDTAEAAARAKAEAEAQAHAIRVAQAQKTRDDHQKTIILVASIGAGVLVLGGLAYFLLRGK